MSEIVSVQGLLTQSYGKRAQREILHQTQEKHLKINFIGRAFIIITITSSGILLNRIIAIISTVFLPIRNYFDSYFDILHQWI